MAVAQGQRRCVATHPSSSGAMTVKVHSFNAGTMCPMSARLVNGSGGLLDRARLVCHIFLVETIEGLVLVDTGLGLGDIANPERLGRGWLRNVSPRLVRSETALAHVEALGFSASDVRHILLTHLDRDHAGGIADFPDAKVHVHVNEQRLRVREGRYITEQWTTVRGWAFYPDGGEDWFGFVGVRPLAHCDDILAIPLHGHTPGHSGIAVRTDGKWRLHAGDSYFHHRQIATPPGPAPLALRIFQRRADTDRAARVQNQERLRRLNEAHGSQIEIVNSHDPTYLS
jgi:glyoxylase-like metal-dependent hydrolase (beta-lactamase superfamily II)